MAGSPRAGRLSKRLDGRISVLCYKALDDTGEP
jgi:hypothetical protein